MLSIIIAVAIGIGIGCALGIDLQSTGWGITCGVAGYVATQIVISLILRKKVNAVQAGIQNEMNMDRERINRQLTTFQQRQPGNMTGLKQLADRLQNEVSRKLLEATERFQIYYPW